MADFPRSLSEFQKRFPDDAACAAYLTDRRWPDGFRCPRCDAEKAWRAPSRQVLTFYLRQVPEGDFGDRWHHYASVAFAAHHLVLGSFSDGDAFQWHVRFAATERAWSRLL